MKPITAAVGYNPGPWFERLVQRLLASPLIERVVIVGGDQIDLPTVAHVDVLRGTLYSGDTLDRLLDRIATEYLLLLPIASDLSFQPD